MSSDCVGTVLGILRRFLSLIIGIVMGFCTLLYAVGAGRVITLEQNFGQAGFAHFLGILLAILSVIFYILLHFVPRKAYRLLYFISGLLVASMFFVSHSLGLAGPVVRDCGVLGLLNYTHVVERWRNLGTVGVVFDEETNTTQAIGTLGEPVRHCEVQGLTFASTLLLLPLYVFALFDVQKVLLARVKSKTYGERFVEMGITN